MRIGRVSRTFWLAVVFAVLLAGSTAQCTRADDGNNKDEHGASSNTEASASAADSSGETPTAIKVTAPVPALTEREQWLLDRVQQLEKRVEELEARQPAGARSEAATAASPAANPANSESSSASSALTSAPASAAIGKANAGAANGQTGEKGQTVASAALTANTKAEPFAFADFTWLTGNARTKDTPYATSFFTPEIRADIDYVYDFAHPKDDTIGGSSEVFRSSEVHVTQLGVGGDFHYDNVRARLMTQFGLYSETTPRNDASPARGQWNLADAYRYLSEAYGGYHFNVLHGINVDAGIFMSYIGLFSYYQFDNWAYQPSYVSSNTPWFFNGVRVQIYPTEHLKIEPWFINGWQSYGRFNNRPGFGFQSFVAAQWLAFGSGEPVCPRAKTRSTLRVGCAITATTASS